MSSWKISSLADKVRRAFSESADQYDILTSLHKEIGRELMHKIIRLPDVQRMVDVGCGTGYLTRKAKFYFPESQVIGVDFAQGMLDKAKEEGEDIIWIAADAQKLPFKDKSVDVIVSNLAYQWAADLPRAFKDARRVLSDKGVLAATLFGFHTCQELFSSLEAAGHPVETLGRLPSLEDVKSALTQVGFSHTNVDYERIQIQFKDLWDLLGWLKNIGANNLSQGQFLGQQTLQEANDYYLKTYPYHDGIRSTFEVIWLWAEV